MESVVRWSVYGAAEKMGFGIAGVPCRRCGVGYAVSAPLAPPKRLRVETRHNVQPLRVNALGAAL